MRFYISLVGQAQSKFANRYPHAPLYPLKCMQPQIHKIIEQTHHFDGSRIYLCQVRVGDKFSPTFYSHEAQRREGGEEFWLHSILENGVGLLADYGAAPPLSY